MNALFEIIKTVILTVAVIKTSSYGIWCIKEKKRRRRNHALLSLRCLSRVFHI